MTDADAMPSAAPWPRRLREARHLLKIGGPLTLAALANMAVSITDVVMMGWLGPLALGAGAAISDIYSVVFYLAAGVAAAGVPLISEAIGASHLERVKSIFSEACVATLLLGFALTPVVWHSARLLDWLGMAPQILPPARAYAHWMALALPPMLLARVFFAYFSATGKTRVVFFTSLGAIPLNILGNGAFMFGWFGFTPLGMPGAGVASFLVAVYLAAALGIAASLDRVFKRSGLLTITRRGVADCWKTGVPIGMTSLGEMGVYLISTVIMVKFGAAAVAAHAVTLRLSGLLYAIPVGLAQAVTVRVAYWRGAKSSDCMRLSVVAGCTLSVVVGTVYLVGLPIVAGPVGDLLPGTGHTAAAVAQLTVALISLLAAVEFFTAIGTVALGALRGIKDTRVPMIYALSCLWGLGFAGGLLLGFTAKLGAVGFWTGLLLGAAGIAVLGLYRVQRIFLRRRMRIPRALAAGVNP